MKRGDAGRRNSQLVAGNEEPPDDDVMLRECRQFDDMHKAFECWLTPFDEQLQLITASPVGCTVEELERQMNELRVNKSNLSLVQPLMRTKRINSLHNN